MTSRTARRLTIAHCKPQQRRRNKRRLMVPPSAWYSVRMRASSFKGLRDSEITGRIELRGATVSSEGSALDAECGRELRASAYAGPYNGLQWSVDQDGFWRGAPVDIAQPPARTPGEIVPGGVFKHHENPDE